MNELVPVLITTKHRGVFFGWVDRNRKSDLSLVVKRCRNCISWAASIGGFLGLASVGPDANCKIGSEAPEVILHDITSVSNVTEAAVEAWLKA